MAFSEQELDEFRTEAGELLDYAETTLLSLESGGDFKAGYDAIFRAFHSIKGAAGMMEMPPLAAHMHKLENTLVQQKVLVTLPKPYIDLFLRGIDGSRKLLRNETIEFNYDVEGAVPTAVAPAAPAAAPTTTPTASAPPAAAAPQVPAQTVQKTAPAPNAKAATPAPTFEGKVLVIDDEPEIVEILTDILQDAHLHVKGTTSPEEAIQLVESFQPDAILTDIKMPKLSGMDVLRTVHANHPDLPIIFVSGEVNKESLIEAVSLGVYGVIEKPFNQSKVLESCLNAVRVNQTAKLLNSTVNLIMYQFYDLDEFLKAQGKNDVRDIIHRELKIIIEQRRKLREVKKLRKNGNLAAS